MILVQILSFIVGAMIVAGALLSAIETLVLPRGAPNLLTRAVFVFVRHLFDLRLHWVRSYPRRDRVLAFFAPVSLLLLLPTWLTMVLIGYMGMFWAVGAGSWYEAFWISGSSLLTLGFAPVEDLPQTVLAFSEATIGLILVAVLIAYLPTMYAAFSRRETAVTLLEVRADNPPSAVEIILRFNRIHGLDRLTEQWQAWETWFADIEESHTSLPALVFFRSPRPDRSWVTAAGAVLDAAALTSSAVDIPADAQAALCVRAGYLALREIADFFSIPYDPDPDPTDPISVTREEFDAACERLEAGGVPLKPDRDQAWRDFAGWRVNYDCVLLDLA
jgi:fumarate reductase subunit D